LKKYIKFRESLKGVKATVINEGKKISFSFQNNSDEEIQIYQNDNFISSLKKEGNIQEIMSDNENLIIKTKKRSREEILGMFTPQKDFLGENDQGKKHIDFTWENYCFTATNQDKIVVKVCKPADNLKRINNCQISYEARICAIKSYKRYIGLSKNFECICYDKKKEPEKRKECEEKAKKNTSNDLACPKRKSPEYLLNDNKKIMEY